jgi:hypothetical protein
MKTKTAKYILLLTSIAVGSVFAEPSRKQDPNPQKDKDVQEGYERHQKEYKEKQQQAERKEKGQIEKPYEVDKSHQDHVKETEKAAGEHAQKK